MLDSSPTKVEKITSSMEKAELYIGRVKIVEAVGEGDRYDAEFYVEHLIRATESLFLPFGYTADRVKEALSGQKQATLVWFAMER